MPEEIKAGYPSPRPWKDRLTSRKFIMAVVTALLIVANDGLELGIPAEAVYSLVAVVGIWIFGESWIDVNSLRQNSPPED